MRCNLMFLIPTALPIVLVLASTPLPTALSAGSESYVFVLKWGGCGFDDGQFHYPIGVAVDGSNHVYIADTWNDRIQKFDSNGNFITRWGSHSKGDGQFDWP